MQHPALMRFVIVVVVILICPSTSLIKRIEGKCCAEFADACHLARKALDPFRTYRISWKTVKNHDGYLLFMNSTSGQLKSYIRRQVNVTSTTSRFTARLLEKVLFRHIDLASPSPAVSLCRSDGFLDILMPAVILSPNEISRHPNKNEWYQKLDKAWYRGHIHSGLGSGSLTLVLEGRTAPGWFDVALLQPFDRRESPFKYESSAVLKELWGSDAPINDAIHNYRFIIDAAEPCSSSKMYDVIGSNIALFKVESNESQWYSRYFMPWIHYIPVLLSPPHVPVDILLSSAVKGDRPVLQSSNILEMMEWARANPDKVFKIIESAYRFYETYLTEDAILCYVEMIIREYAALCNFNVFEKVAELHTSRIRVEI